MQKYHKLWTREMQCVNFFLTNFSCFFSLQIQPSQPLCLADPGARIVLEPDSQKNKK